MQELVKSVSALVIEEYTRAAAEHGGAANTPHEGWALIKEELEEAEEQMPVINKKVQKLWDAVKCDALNLQEPYLDGIKTAAILGACELIQVAAMAEKARMGLKTGAGETKGEEDKEGRQGG